jgi:hypothetical protein
MNTREREIDLLSDEINQLSDHKLDAVSGETKYIHMPYGDFSKWPGGDPSPTRIAPG